MNLIDIINDPKSTEQSFKFFTLDYALDLIFSDFDNDSYKRAVLVKLDNVPAMLATSETNVENELFVNLLKNAKNAPLGTKLFEPKSGIRRRKMTVTQLNKKAVNDSLIFGYLNALGFDHDVYLRESIFSCNKQTMNLKEYVLPGLKFVMNKHNSLDNINA